jgi:hypothetical protein
MKNIFTNKLKSILAGSSAFALLLTAGAGVAVGQIGHYGSLAGRNNTGGVSAASHCISLNMLSNNRITDTEATLAWNPNITADAYRLIYTSITTGVSTQIVMGPGNTYVNLTGLAPAEQYKWYVESVCSSGTHTSNIMKFSTLAPLVPRNMVAAAPVRNITNPVSFCPSIGTVAMLDMGYDKAIISWSRTYTYDSILVRYAPTGTTNYKINSFVGSPNSGRYFLTGLAGQTSYDIWVSTYCNSAYSTWSAPVTVTTLPEPPPRIMADKGPASTFTMSPNPATDETVISFNAKANTNAEIRIYDITGKEIYNTTTITVEGKNNIKFDLSNFYKGIYLVKAAGDNLQSVQRLVIQ